jgi:hypothetical protein
MSRNPTEPAKEIAEAVVIGAAGGAATALATGLSPVVPAAIGAGAGVAGSIARFIMSSLERKRERRWISWIGAYVNATPNVDADLVVAQLHAKGGDPLVQEIVIEGARAVDEALSDVVVPALARLTREYVSEEKRGDGFFRGTRRLLSDLGDDEFDALRGLLRAVVAADVALTEPEIRLVYRATKTPPDVAYLRPLPADEAKARALQNETVHLCKARCALRLFHLLRINDLGSEGVSGGFGAQTGPHVISLDVATAQRLLQLLE